MVVPTLVVTHLEFLNLGSLISRENLCADAVRWQSCPTSHLRTEQPTEMVGTDVDYRVMGTSVAIEHDARPAARMVDSQ